MSTFDYSKLKVVFFDFDGVFTDNSVYVSEDGKESVRCSRFDGFGLRLLEKCGVEGLIISTEKNPVVLRRAEKLKLNAFNGVDDKFLFIQNYIKNKNIKLDQCAFVGNDLNDIESIENCGLGIAVADSYTPVLNFADIITTKKGGDGVVREICELIYYSKTQFNNIWDKKLIDELIHKR